MPTEEITIEDLVNWYLEEKGIEIWKDIPGYEGLYQVSNTGKVKSLERKVNTFGGKRGVGERILRPHHRRKKYLGVILSKEGVHKDYSIHRLVAEAWVPNPLNLPQVNHIDEDVQNNNAANLEWCDCKFNINWGTGHKRAIDPQCKTVEQYTLDGQLIAKYSSAMEATRKTGLTHISAVCRGERKQAGGYVWKYA